jgi:hypothetical protein
MALVQTPWALGKISAPVPGHAGEVVAARYVHTLLEAENASGQIIEMGPLPAGMEPVGWALDADDLDAGSAQITLDVGLLSGEFGSNPTVARTMAAEVFAASTVGQSATLVYPSLKTALRIAAAENDRGIGVKVLLEAATAAEGEIGLTVFYRAKQ